MFGGGVAGHCCLLDCVRRQCGSSTGPGCSPVTLCVCSPCFAHNRRSGCVPQRFGSSPAVRTRCVTVPGPQRAVFGYWFELGSKKSSGFYTVHEAEISFPPPEASFWR